MSSSATSSPSPESGEQAPVRYATTPPRPPGLAPKDTPITWAKDNVPSIVGAVLLLAFVAWCAFEAFGPTPADDARLPAQGALTLAVFAIAIWLWIFSSIGDTYVALGAAIVLVLTGMLSDSQLFSSLGEDTVWLLLAAFVIAAGVTATGLSTRAAVYIVTGATGVRQLVYLVTGVLVATAFAIPSTSGRAALALPIFVALAQALHDRKRLVLALSLLFPSVILLSAVASYLGAGTHIITSQILQTSGYEGFSFTTWLIFGLPLAVVSSYACAELIMWLFLDKEGRSQKLDVSVEKLEEHTSMPLTGPLTVGQSRAALLTLAVVLLWCTESLHGLHPAVVALLGALLATSPGYGLVTMGKALKTVPWSMLLFMAATLTLGTALVESGAADWLAHRVLGPVSDAGAAAGVVFVVVVVVMSTAAHLIIQSRSARSAVLIPIVVSLAPGIGVDPMAAAFASTAAAGFCHTLTSSAKPVTLFSDVEGIETYQPKDLLRLSAFLAPLMVGMVLFFSFVIWPLMGMPLFL